MTMTRCLYEDMNEGRKIFANYNLHFPSEKLSSDFFTTFNKSKNKEQLYNCSVGIDEMQIMLDCRDSGKSRNKILSYFFLQTRKRKVNLYYTTQQFENVDVRLRKNTDVLIKCEKIIMKINAKIKKGDIAPTLPVIKILIIFLRKDIHFVDYFPVQEYSDKYDTDEIIELLEG